MKSFINIFMIFLALFNLQVLLAQVNSRSFQLKDVRKIVSLSEPQISPDGKEIAVIVTRRNWDKDSSLQEIDLVDAATGTYRSLTYNRKDISNPRWSPDGNSLAFISDDNETDKPQIFVMSMKGGDPIKITNSKTGVDEFSWSPDGNEIAFVAQDTVPNPKAIKHHEDAFQVTYNNYMVNTSLQPWHIWIINAKGKGVKRLTEGTWSLKTDQESISPLAWSTDGKSIVFQHFPDVWEGDSWHSIISEVDTSGGKVKTVVKEEATSMPCFSPDHQTLAFMRPRNGDLNNGYAVYLLSNNEVKDITKELARNISSYKWMPDGKTILFTGEKGTKSVIWFQPVSEETELLNLGDVNVNGGNLSISKNGVISFVGSTSSHPAELYILDSIHSVPKRLTDFNSFVDSLSLGKSTNIDWKGPGGFDEDAVLTYPVNYKSGEKYPLVLVIHGGPEGASTVAFSILAQLFASKGFFVFQPNYRGSINLGDKYQHAIFKDTGEGPGKDVMAGLDKIERMGMIDTNRIGISGWSYGGYMTSWLNGYYPNKWKAAVEGAALNDWVMDYTIAYYQTGDIYFFGGSPWTKDYWNIWRDQSPIIFARNVKAPTLILGDQGDPNVPIVNSYEMYHALFDNGVKTEFYTYPVDTHFPHDIVRTTDVYKRWIDWIVKYVK
jgi:dipeptidyl aminopeptidase/acylaminoacyl peptidase